MNSFFQKAPVKGSLAFLIGSVMGRIKRYFAYLFIALMSSSVLAVQEPLQPYPSGKVEISTHETRQNHPVISSRMKRINGVVTSDNASWQSGNLHRTLYQLPSGSSSEQGYEFFAAKLKEQGVNPIFECQSFSCGASNFWANEIFEIPRLYGQDKEQFYFIGESSNTYYFVYAVKRGNGRVYTLVDAFKPEGGVKRVDEKASDSSLSLILSEAVDLQKALAPLHEKLKSNDNQQVLFIISGALPATISGYEQSLERMNKWSSRLKDALDNLNISKERYRTHISLCKGCGGVSIKDNNQDLILEGVMLN